MEAARRELVRELLLEVARDDDDAWIEAVDADSPPWLFDWMRETRRAYRTGDVEWILEHADPQVEISQPPELPDARTYRRGHEGMIDAFLDWPNEWADFTLEPRRVFALDQDRIVVIAIHRGRSLRMGIEVEVEIVWLYTLRQGLLSRWQMFVSLDDAVRAAAG